MKRKFRYITAAFLILCPLKAGAELLEPLSDVYWQPSATEQGGGIFSDTGGHQYEEQGLCSVPDDLALLPPETAVPAVNTKPVIAIVIDDMGLDHKRSSRATLLPPEVTLAYIPYSPHIKEQTATAKAKGHTLIVHVPMEPERETADPGPDYLDADLSPLELHDRVVKNLEAFDGYVGVNNHMGSAFTQNTDAMNILMTELKLRDLVFLDSKTVPNSVGEKVAHEAGVPVTHRDVFIDHFEDAKMVAHALQQIETFAKRSGSAVAIGHPKDVTLNALEKWLPTLEAKGFRLVPVTEVIKLREEQRKNPKPAVTVAEGKTEKAAPQ